MNNYRERLVKSGQLEVFEMARSSSDRDQMSRILQGARFTPAEIESILWANGELGTPPEQPDKKQAFRDAIAARIGVALITGLILGGIFVWASASYGIHPGHELKAMMKDYRTPQAAYYTPFLWGFALGFVVGLLKGTLVSGPSSSERDD